MLSSQSLLREAGVELAGDVALEAADGFGFGLAFGAASLEVVAGCGVVGEPGDHDAPERAVGLTVTTTAESMPLLFAARGVERRGSAESGEGSFVVDPARVLAGGDEQRAGGVGADPDSFDQLGRGFGDEWCEELVEHVDLVIEFEDTPREGLERDTIRVRDIGASRGTEPASGAQQPRDGQVRGAGRAARRVRS